MSDLQNDVCGSSISIPFRRFPHDRSKSINRLHRWWIAAGGVLAISSPLLGDPYIVNTGFGTGNGSLAYGIGLANAGTITSIVVDSSITQISMTQQLFVNANVSIDGNHAQIDMGGQDRAFFLAGGNITIENLTISNAIAKGGNGVDGGGGGAGLGGGIFVANGNSITGSGVTLPTQVTLAGVKFSSNSAVGGDGSSRVIYAAGGGGGMGGSGGLPDNSDSTGGGGGGGFGVGADGGSSGFNGSPGAFLSSGPAGASNNGGAGGPSGGGGGGGSSDATNAGSGGGGGVNGADAASAQAGAGGFGGGGAGFDHSAADGGFGGGGGAAGNLGASEIGLTGGNGGFGGGGGAGTISGPNNWGGGGLGGFAAGKGGDGTSLEDHCGGGGAGLGGAIFVMKGASLSIDETTTFEGNSTNYGTASGPTAADGQNIADNIFVGGDLTINVALGKTLTAEQFTGASIGQSQDTLGNLTIAGGGTVTVPSTISLDGNVTVTNNSILHLGSGGYLDVYSIELGQYPGDKGQLTVDLEGLETPWNTTLIGSPGSGIIHYKLNGAQYSSLTQVIGDIALNVEGSGIFTVDTALENTGTTTISGGTFKIGDSFQGQVYTLASTFVIDGGIFDLNGSTLSSSHPLLMTGGVLTDSDPNQGGLGYNGPSLQASGGQIDSDIVIDSTFVVGGAHDASLTITAGIKVRGPDTIIVGMSNDSQPGSATLNLQGGATLKTATALGGTIKLGGAEGDLGRLVIGDGGAAPNVQFYSIASGAGSGEVVFEETSNEDGSSPEYSSFLQISGNVSVIQQNSSGTTILFGMNSYTGKTIVNGGILRLGIDTALPSSSAVEVNGGQLDLAGVDITSPEIALNKGAIIDSTGGASIQTGSLTTVSGTLGASFSGTGSLIQNGSAFKLNISSPPVATVGRVYASQVASRSALLK